MNKWLIHLEEAKEIHSIESESNENFKKLINLKLKYAKQISVTQYENKIEIECLIAEKIKEKITIKSTNLNSTFEQIKMEIEKKLFEWRDEI